MKQEDDKNLRRGWTTGACATAATKAALVALLTGEKLKTVTITLPGGQTPTFNVEALSLSKASATAGIIKDAGDDPDVTHGALIRATVSRGGTGVSFRAGQGVGTITKAGLPIPPGEAAINPVPRKMMQAVVEALCKAHKHPVNIIIEISVPKGEALAKQTWNPRLGIIGGISILGTTGIVVPYSCSAWIHSIHRGIDVARAANSPHIGAAVGNTSEKLIIKRHKLAETELIDMGDFVGGMLKYLKKHPVPKLTIAGGFAKMSKLALGAMDLHSKRSEVDKEALAALLKAAGAGEDQVSAAETANTALEILLISQQAGIDLGDRLAAKCLAVVHEKLAGGPEGAENAPISVEILLSDRNGKLVGRAADPAF